MNLPLPDTVLSYKKDHKLGRFDPSAGAKADAQPDLDEVAKSVPVGSRCKVDLGNAGLEKRGTIRFVGPTKFGGGGIWVGIEYDEPLGKNDGS